MPKPTMPKPPRKRIPAMGRAKSELDRIDGYQVLQNDHTHPLRAMKLESGDLLVIGFSTWKDAAALDVRVHFLTPAPDRWWQPTKQGIRIDIADAGKVLEFIAQHKDIVKQLLGESK